METVQRSASAETVTGIAMMCIGVACLSVNDAIAKTLTDTYHPIQILLMRNAIALPFAAGIALAMGGPRALRSYRPSAHLVRGTLWIAAAICFFSGLRYLGLAEATTLVFAAPVFITGLSALILKEDVGWRRWTAVLVGFAGVIIVVRPGGATFQAASLFPVATAMIYALLMISARWVDPRESVWTMMLYLVAAGALLSALLVPLVWVPLQMTHLWLFFAIALFGTCGMALMTQAFRFAPAAVVAPFDYTALLWATILGWLLWNEVPDSVTYLGASIIIGSGLFIVWREQRIARSA